MTQFVTKEVLNLRSVGEILRVKRLELGKTLEQASSVIGVGVQYLEGIEQNRFETLPGPLYTKQFIRRYCEYLGIGEMSQVLFDRIQHISPTSTLVKQVPVKELMVFSKLFRYGAVGLVVFVLSIFACVQLYTFVAPPSVDVAKPVVFTNHRLIDIAGTTRNARTVVVNNEEVPVDTSGYFRATVPLVEGINTLKVVATSGRGNVNEQHATVYYVRGSREQQFSSRK